MLFFTGRCQFHLFDKKFLFPYCMYIRKVVLLLQSNLHTFLYFRYIS